MKSITLLIGLILSSSISFAFINKTPANKVEEYCWTTNNLENQYNEVNEQWIKEDAVILYQEFSSSYSRYSGVLIKPKYLCRMKIKVLKQEGVNEFKEIKLRTGFITKYGVKIKKHNSDKFEKVIFNETNSVTSDDYVKLAIPNLEINDIIEIFTFQLYYGDNYVYQYFKTFDFGHRYPIQKLLFEFGFEKNLSVYCHREPGIPKLSPTESDHKRYSAYKFEKENIAPIDQIDIKTLSGQVPYIKFGVFDPGNMTSQKAKRYPDEGEILYNIPLEKINSHYTNFIKNRNPATDLLTLFNEMGGESLSKKEQVNLLLYIQNIRSLSIGKHKIKKLKLDWEKIDLSTALTKLKIPHEYVLISRGTVEIDKQVSPKYYYWIRAKIDGEYIYSQDIPSRRSGAKVYVREVYPVKEEQYRVDHVHQNEQISYQKKLVTNISLTKENLGQEKIKVSSEYTLSSERRRIFSLSGTTDRPCTSYMEHSYPSELRTILKDKRIESMLMVFEQRKLEDELNKYKGINKDSYILVTDSEDGCINNNVSNRLNYELSISTDSTDILKVAQTKSSYSNADSIHQYIFDYNTINPSRKMGPDYIISLESLLKPEANLDELNEIKSDLKFKTPFVLSQSLVFEVPTGYKLEGLDELSKNNVNEEFGEFNVNTKENNGTYTIEISKTLNEMNLNPEDWKNWVEINKKAFNLTQKELLLTKI